MLVRSYLPPVLTTQQLADALNRGIAVAAGILRQQLVGKDRAVRPPRHDIGEGAAAIDPEIPAAVRLHRHAHTLLGAL